jgi:hypothetical protein
MYVSATRRQVQQKVLCVFYIEHKIPEIFPDKSDDLNANYFRLENIHSFNLQKICIWCSKDNNVIGCETTDVNMNSLWPICIMENPGRVVAGTADRWFESQ